MIQASQLIAAGQLNAEINRRTWEGMGLNASSVGIVGDGVTDNTEKLQSLVNQANASGIQTIIMPPGQYKVTTLTNTSGLLFIGDGASFVGGYSGTILPTNTIAGVGSLSQLGTVPRNLAISLKERAYNVKDFGAKGDDTDDTAAFQAAIAAAATTGGTVIVPSVQYWYRITDTLDIPDSVTLVGHNWTFNGSSILKFFMDGKPLTSPAIKVHGVENVHFGNLYILNGGIELRDGLAIDGSSGMNSFVSARNIIVTGFGKNFYVNNTWLVSFRDCYGKGGTYGWYVAGGTITTCLIDHCYAESNAQDGYYISGAYYSTLISSATDFCNKGYHFSSANAVTMIGCGCEGAKATAIDIAASTLVIDGFTSVGNGTDTDINYATVLNAVNSFINVRGVYEQSIASPNSKISTISLNSGVTGEYVTCKEMLPIYYPKNGRFLFNGQAFTAGVPTATGWLSTDIGKVVYESAPVQAGTSPNKYVIFGYQRLTAGNGNALNTDWLALRALTGN